MLGEQAAGVSKHVVLVEPARLAQVRVIEKNQPPVSPSEELSYNKARSRVDGWESARWVDRDLSIQLALQHVGCLIRNSKP